MPTPHINAQLGDFAKVVLMPGDPKRAKWVADTFLHDVKEVTNVRGMLGFTGLTANNKRISVMASGMGLPSIGIYSHELFNYYGVDIIIRIGTCGSYQKECDLGDIILAQAACTDSNWPAQFELAGGTLSAVSDFELLVESKEAADARGFKSHVGAVVSSDVFYDSNPHSWEKWASLGVLAVEMEAYGLFINAQRSGKKAMAICTVSDSFINKRELSAEERQTGLVNMVQTAIDVAEKHV